MAKLTAHGHELVRLVRTRPELDDAEDPARPNALRCIDHKTFLSIRSDGHILQRNTFRWADTRRIHDGGWKLFKRVKREHANTMPDLVRAALRLADSFARSGYTIEEEHASVTIARASVATAPEDSGS